MHFAKLTFLSFMTTSLKLLNGLFLVKLISLHVGPEGLAKAWQFISFISFLILFAGGGINQGIIKYISQYQGDNKRLKSILGTGIYLMSSSIFILFISIILYRNYLSQFLFGTEKFSYIFIFVAFGQIFMALNNYFIAIINGFKEILKLSVVNFLGTATSAISALILIKYYGFDGILISYIFSQSFTFIFSFYICTKIKEFKLNFLYQKFNKKDANLLLRFSIMNIISAFLTNMIQILTRNHLARNFSWIEVGYWEGTVKISDAYIILITTVLSIYCVPSLSSKKYKVDIIQELKKIFKVIVPLTCLLAFIIFVLKDFIILILFTNEFFEIKKLLFWQLVGDVMRVTGMVFSYFLLSKALIKTFICIEIISSVTFLILVNLLTHNFGLEGAICAFTINSLLFCILSSIFSLKELFKLP